MFIFKHEINNRTLSNDWPTYCQTGIIARIYYDGGSYMNVIGGAYE